MLKKLFKFAFNIKLHNRICCWMVNKSVFWWLINSLCFWSISLFWSFVWIVNFLFIFQSKKCLKFVFNTNLNNPVYFWWISNTYGKFSLFWTFLYVLLKSLSLYLSPFLTYYDCRKSYFTFRNVKNVTTPYDKDLENVTCRKGLKTSKKVSQIRMSHVVMSEFE